MDQTKIRKSLELLNRDGYITSLNCPFVEGSEGFKNNKNNLKQLENLYGEKLHIIAPKVALPDGGYEWESIIFPASETDFYFDNCANIIQTQLKIGKGDDPIFS